jgi:hypothetical protein
VDATGAVDATARQRQEIGVANGSDCSTAAERGWGGEVVVPPGRLDLRRRPLGIEPQRCGEELFAAESSDCSLLPAAVRPPARICAGGLLPHGSAPQGRPKVFGGHVQNSKMNV